MFSFCRDSNLSQQLTSGWFWGLSLRKLWSKKLFKPTFWGVCMLKYSSTAGSCSCKMVGISVALGRVTHLAPFCWYWFNHQPLIFPEKNLYFLFSITDFTAFPGHLKLGAHESYFTDLSTNAWTPWFHCDFYQLVRFQPKKNNTRRSTKTFHVFKAWSNKYPY